MKSFLPNESLEHAMAKAVALAQQARSLVAPNPMVGAVILDSQGQLVAEGFHHGPGTPHAEVHAIREAQSQGIHLADATLVVTLEPCRHYGRTPPCTELILNAGIKKVAVGVIDPNPLMSGKSVQDLKGHGVSVVTGVHERACDDLIRGFRSVMANGRPYVTCKIAGSIDGRISPANRKSKWITGELARQDVQRERTAHDAVLVGVGTILADDPQLNARSPLRNHGWNPKRVVLDTALRTPSTARFLQTPGKSFIYCAPSASATRRNELEKAGAVVVAAEIFDLSWILEDLAQKGIQEVLVEGGARIFASFVRQRLCDRLLVYMAPLLLGDSGLPFFQGLPIESLNEAIRCGRMSVRPLGEDFKFEGFDLVYGTHPSDRHPPT